MDMGAKFFGHEASHREVFVVGLSQLSTGLIWVPWGGSWLGRGRDSARKHCGNNYRKEGLRRDDKWLDPKSKEYTYV